MPNFGRVMLSSQSLVHSVHYNYIGQQRLPLNRRRILIDTVTHPKITPTSVDFLNRIRMVLCILRASLCHYR
jgi:hypothetical protein